MEVKVSIIIPTHNRPELFEQSLKSVIKQDYENKEIIVVMDGCDKTFDAYIKLAREYDAIPFYDIAHEGCPGALNYGINKSTGDLICVLADDDLMYGNNSLTLRVNGFDKNTDVIYTGANSIDINNKIMDIKRAEPVNKDLIWKLDYINIQSMMWRRSLHEKIGYFSIDLINNEDWEWKIKCLMESTVKMLDCITVSSRYHGQNKSIANRDITNKCADILMKRMKKKYNV